VLDTKLSLPYGSAIVHKMHLLETDIEFAHILGYKDCSYLLAQVSTLFELFDANALEDIENEVELTQLGYALPNTHLENITHRNGTSIPVAIMFEQSKWNGLKAVKMTVIDTTNAQHKYQSLREQDQMFRAMILNSAQGILVHRDFKPLFVNQSWVKLQGAESSEQVLAMDSILPLLRKETIPDVRQHYRDLIERTHSGASTVVENIGLDGVSRYFNIYDNVILWQGEEAVQVVLEDVSDKVKLENKLKFHAEHDDLTQLYNRRAVYQWLQQQASQQRPLVCLLMDIDNFKIINDKYGHNIGDNVIQAFATTANKIIRDKHGVVGRWGGEEFIAFLPISDNLQCRSIAEEVCKKFGRLTFECNQQSQFKATVSIGITNTFELDDASSVDALIHRADTFLYTAKASGKNQVCVNCSACEAYC
jgi:diguanylate cyclase (GGDEF)-like protein/PAS domain S-box-containing protein